MPALAIAGTNVAIDAEASAENDVQNNVENNAETHAQNSPVAGTT